MTQFLKPLLISPSNRFSSLAYTQPNTHYSPCLRKDGTCYDVIIGLSIVPFSCGHGYRVYQGCISVVCRGIYVAPHLRSMTRNEGIPPLHPPLPWHDSTMRPPPSTSPTSPTTTSTLPFPGKVMSAGAIPVFVARDIVRPFQEKFDWAAFSFMFSPDQVGPAMMRTLRAVSDDELEEMQVCRYVFRFGLSCSVVDLFNFSVSV